MKFIILLCIHILFLVESEAKFIKGYLVTHAGDTIHGQVNIRGIKPAPKSIFF